MPERFDWFGISVGIADENMGIVIPIIKIDIEYIDLI